MCSRQGRAETPTGETIEGIKELTAPASRAEIRGDASVLATRHAADTRADVAVEIAPRPDYWYGLGAAAVTRTTTTIDADGQVVGTTETKDALVISARFFKRIGPLVLSAGVVDSAGGAGLELRALDDRVRVEVLASNWRPLDVRAAPHLRVGGSAQWRFLYVQAGTLDVVDGARDHAYVGVGLRWRDPDLLATLFWVKR